MWPGRVNWSLIWVMFMMFLSEDWCSVGVSLVYLPFLGSMRVPLLQVFKSKPLKSDIYRFYLTLIFSAPALSLFTYLKICYCSGVDLNFCNFWLFEWRLGLKIARAFTEWLCISMLLSWVCAFQVLSVFPYIYMSAVLTHCGRECKYPVRLVLTQFWKSGSFFSPLPLNYLKKNIKKIETMLTQSIFFILKCFPRLRLVFVWFW